MVHPDKNAIRRSGLTIYDRIPSGRPDLYIASKKLEEILKESLVGFSLSGLALRTRSKVVKTEVCKAIGYPVPGSFKRTQPRFPGQNFDVYIQKSNNLQIWNEELDASRRYVIVRVDEDTRIGNVRVISGAELAKLDRTGTLTQKYQATLDVGAEACELVSREDTISAEFIGQESSARLIDPTEDPSLRSLIPIQTLFGILKCTIGMEIDYVGMDQERNRGSLLHEIVAKLLGYPGYADKGTFPDIPHQLLEIKLQTSRTIDLGLVTPDSLQALDYPAMDGDIVLRHCDVRYALFYGELTGNRVRITNFYLTTGRDFFLRFRRFEGNVLNKKLQIPLPPNFFI